MVRWERWVQTDIRSSGSLFDGDVFSTPHESGYITMEEAACDNSHRAWLVSVQSRMKQSIIGLFIYLLVVAPTATATATAAYHY